MPRREERDTIVHVSVSKRWLTPALPFAVSLCLSAFTVGTHAYWQDSGLYLSAIHGLGVLYPPGFALYEFLAFLWTKLLFFADFTLAVHLFSSLCAASAAAILALAARDLLRSRGPLFRVTDDDPGDLADACGMLAGVVLACGYTFGSTAIAAKGYAFYDLVLSLLIWSLIRADERRRPGDFRIAAVFIGLAWQAHPSAALTGLALLLFVGVHARALGAKSVAVCTAIAAAAALGPSLLLLPWYASMNAPLRMGNPDGIASTLAYLVGRRFFQVPDVFGFDAGRAASFARFFWEEFLGVGLLLVGVGLATLALKRRPLFWGLLAWTLPYALVTILFKLEGQHDCWFVGAWLPLYLALAVGAYGVARRVGDRARPLLLAAGAIAAAWSTIVNLPDLAQRDYVTAEHYGHTLLQNVDPDAILLLQGDDAVGLTLYLQQVRRVRPDVLIVSANSLGSPGFDPWFFRRHPTLKIPDYGAVAFGTRPVSVATAAFLNGNAGGGRALFCEQFVPPDLIRPDYALLPAGAVWKLVPRGTGLDPRYWSFPVEPEALIGKQRRARGQRAKMTPTRLEVEPEAYEERLIHLVVMARYHLAMGLTEKGDYLAAGRLCESIFALDPKYRDRPEIVHHYAISMLAAGETAKAEPALRRSAEISVLPRNRATAALYLGELARGRGDEAEAARRFRQALETPGLDDVTRRDIETRSAPRR